MNQVLLNKLDAFIRKYYKNQLIRGGIWVFTGVLSAFLIASLLEYFGHFSSTTRTYLFLFFAAFSLFILVKFFVIPLLKLYKLGKTIDYEQAALIIGSHFLDVKDKLINTLQLGMNNPNNDGFLQAAIDQKTEELQPVPFQSAIDLKNNVRYLKYAALPLFSLFAILLIAPGFKESSKRLVNYNEQYIQKAPFTFVLINKNLECLENEPFTIKLKLKGKVIPQDVFLHIDKYKYRLNFESDSKFEYTLNQVVKSSSFYFEAEGFQSKKYELQVVKKPTLLAFKAYIDYPNYTGIKDELIDNTSNFVVPVGTSIRWSIKAKHVDRLVFKNEENRIFKTERKKGIFSFVKRFLKSEQLKLISSNVNVETGDSMDYGIQIVPDEYPTIEVEEKEDSLSSKIRYMIGKVSDDYGFKKLVFRYRFTQSDSNHKVSTAFNEVPIKLNTRNKAQSFYYFWDISSLGIAPNDRVEYFFEIWDNDGVHGSKSVKSTPKIFKAPSLDEISKQTDKTTEKLKDDLAKNSKNIESLEKEMLELEKKLTERKKLSWEDKKRIKEMLNKHKKMKNDLQKVVDENKKNNAREEEYKPIDKEIKEKQEQIEKLMDEVMDDEMKELMEKINELMQKNQKNELMDKLNDLKVADKEVNKQLERMLEQLKQLQLEKKINDAVDKLNKIAKEQMKLSEESKEGKKPNEELKKKQEDLIKKYDKLKKELDDINKKNKELEKPLKMDAHKEKESEKKASEEQQKSKDNLSKNKKSKASEDQKKAADEMKKQANSLQKQMQMAMKKQEVEDYNTLREILENLVQVSKDQEELIGGFKAIRSYNPKYIELAQRQKKLRDDTKMIEDSLTALSKRVEQIEYFINKEMGLVNSNMAKTMTYLGERQTRRVLVHEQYVMTSLNNLALMLSEVLKQMQEQMKKKQGKGSCNNPGQNKNSQSQSSGLKGMKQMQESLKKQLEAMQEGMGKDGKSGKGGKGGKKPGSKEFAQAAAAQAAIRKKLNDLQKQLEKEGQGGQAGELSKTQDIMDDLEKDLYNKKLNGDVIKRQQEILTRLLEHEKAAREQEKDNKRKSNEGKDVPRKIPPNIEKYLKQKQKEEELLKTLPPDLKPYYKQKVRTYFEQMSQ